MSSFYNQVARKVRVGINDLLNPESNSSQHDSYSHTAASTAGYSQRSTYPKLPESNYERGRQNVIAKTDSLAATVLNNIIGENAGATAAHTINHFIGGNRCAKDLFRHGAVIQLVSKSSGRFLQMVMSANGLLVFDGAGDMGSFNTYFYVEQIDKDRIRLHNNFNYLAFENKRPCVKSFPPGPKNNSTINFRVVDVLGVTELVALESCECKNHYISILRDGRLKMTDTKEKTVDTHFSVMAMKKEMATPFPYQTQPQHPPPMNPYDNPPPYAAHDYADGQASVSYPQPSAPPPPYTENDHAEPSPSSGLYPKFS